MWQFSYNAVHYHLELLAYLPKATKSISNKGRALDNLI